MSWVNNIKISKLFWTITALMLIVSSVSVGLLVKGFAYGLPVADLKNDRVQVFDADGRFLFKWGTSGSGEGQFSAPAGIAIDKDDNIYVSEIGNNRVQVFDKKGNFLTAWGREGSGNGEFGNLHGIYCDRATGWIYVADTANNRIQVFKPVSG